MLKELIFGIIGGLGLFIFGIKLMSDGLQKVAGEKMRNIISHLTNNRLRGLTLGAIITSIIQSSSATTVMVVGFVNAGLMTLMQAVPVILGANIGTTITAQLIAFKLTDYALPIIAIGAFLYMFSKKRIRRQIGEAILGFGILFLGLSIMAGSVKTLGNGSVIHNMFTTFSANPYLAVFVGMLATAIVQSSSVTTGIIVVLAGMGVVDLQGALPLLFGTNIGTCVTAMIASIKTNITAKRAAVAHVLFNVIGTIIAFIMLPLYVKIITAMPGDAARQVANGHTLFNVVNSLIFIGFVPAYVKLVKRLVPGEEVIIEQGPKFLDKNLLYTPSIAIGASRNEIQRTLKFTKEMVDTSISAFHNENRKDIEQVLAREEMIDSLQAAITDYLVKITEKEITEKEAKMIPSLLHSINDIERIGDHAENIAYLAERKIDEDIKLTATAKNELDQMHEVIKEMMNLSIRAIETLDKKLTKKILLKENELNRLFVKFRENHVKRVGKRECKSITGVIFVDMLANFEKIGDHLANIAQAIEGRLQWNSDDIK